MSARSYSQVAKSATVETEEDPGSENMPGLEVLRQRFRRLRESRNGQTQVESATTGDSSPEFEDEEVVVPRLYRVMVTVVVVSESGEISESQTLGSGKLSGLAVGQLQSGIARLIVPPTVPQDLLVAAQTSVAAKPVARSSWLPRLPEVPPFPVFEF